MPPIKEMFHQEILAARAARAQVTRKLMAKHAAMLQDAQDDATQQRAIEGMAVRSLMVTVDAMARESLQFTKILPKLQAKITNLVEQAIDDEEVPLQKLQQIITWATMNLDMLAKAAEKAQNLERKYLGEADSTIRIIDDRTPQEKATNLLSTLMALRDAGRLSYTPKPEEVLDGMERSQVLRNELDELEAHVEPEEVQALLEE